MTNTDFKPMLCKAAEELPAGNDWSYEIKWDGHRCVARVTGSGVTLTSRSGHDMTAKYPKLMDELSRFPEGVYDGELVVLDGLNSSFTAICTASNHGGDGVTFVVFDVVVANRTLTDRRAMVAKACVDAASPWIIASPVFFNGPELLEWARTNAQEGIVCKQTNGQYVENNRGQWLKVKVRHEQEFVVVGWTPGKGALAGKIGAIILAVNDSTAGKFVYVGKCGTGPHTENERLLGILKTLVTPASTVGDTAQDRLGGPEFRSVTWVEPKVVVQIAFQRWTDDGSLWHPSYKGERTDKFADDVIREIAA